VSPIQTLKLSRKRHHFFDVDGKGVATYNMVYDYLIDFPKPALWNEEDQVALEVSDHSRADCEFSVKTTLAFESDVGCDDEFAETPCQARFSLDQSDALQILRFAKIAHDNDVYEITKFDYRVEYFATDDSSSDCEELRPFRSDCDLLHVTCDRFWFSAYPKYGCIEFTTQPFRLSVLGALIENVDS